MEIADPITSKSLLNGSLRGEEKEAGNPAASTSKPFAGFDWGKAQESESTKATADKPQPFQGFGAKKPSEPFAFGSNAGAQGQESLFGQTPQKSGMNYSYLFDVVCLFLIVQDPLTLFCVCQGLL